MKKYLIGVFAIVFALGLNAFTVLSHDKVKGTSAVLHWFEYDPGSGQATDYLDEGERAGFEIEGCEEDSGPDCRRGYPVSALISSGTPSLGVTDPDLNEDQIQTGD